MKQRMKKCLTFLIVLAICLNTAGIRVSADEMNKDSQVSAGKNESEQNSENVQDVITAEAEYINPLYEESFSLLI